MSIDSRLCSTQDNNLIENWHWHCLFEKSNLPLGLAMKLDHILMEAGAKVNKVEEGINKVEVKAAAFRKGLPSRHGRNNKLAPTTAPAECGPLPPIVEGPPDERCEIGIE